MKRFMWVAFAMASTMVVTACGNNKRPAMRSSVTGDIQQSTKGLSVRIEKIPSGPTQTETDASITIKEIVDLDKPTTPRKTDEFSIECSHNGAKVDCDTTAPLNLKSLSVGKHTVVIKAVDKAVNKKAGEVRAEFEVKAAPAQANTPPASGNPNANNGEQGNGNTGTQNDRNEEIAGEVTAPPAVAPAPAAPPAATPETPATPPAPAAPPAEVAQLPPVAPVEPAPAPAPAPARPAPAPAPARPAATAPGGGSTQTAAPVKPAATQATATQQTEQAKEEEEKPTTGIDLNWAKQISHVFFYTSTTGMTDNAKLVVSFGATALTYTGKVEEPNRDERNERGDRVFHSGTLRTSNNSAEVKCSDNACSIVDITLSRSDKPGIVKLTLHAFEGEVYDYSKDVTSWVNWKPFTAMGNRYAGWAKVRIQQTWIHGLPGKHNPFILSFGNAASNPTYVYARLEAGDELKAEIKDHAGTKLPTITEGSVSISEISRTSLKLNMDFKGQKSFLKIKPKNTAHHNFGFPAALAKPKD
ncbi:MAG TPA: hypothetical protein VFV50_08300 [Bdellovibrionales bacterium]|nr:hypothetical protein [Bdellovibrionales bacterium]